MQTKNTTIEPNHLKMVGCNMFLIKNKKSAKWNDILKIYYIAYYKWFFSYKLLNSLIQGGSLKKLAQIVFMVRLSFLS